MASAKRPRRATSVARKPSKPLEKSQAVEPTLSVSAEIYAIVRAIPKGRVATYGQIAELAGMPSGHRIVARAMRVCPKGLPWQRVVGKKDARRAQISVQDPEQIAQQRKLLAREGVRFDINGFIVLRAYGWLPA
jgi:methylated-DNA-protein-cysteine methyltransferase-like protein